MGVASGRRGSNFAAEEAKRGVDSSAAIRQRVSAALGRSRSAAASAPLRQRRSKRAVTPERSAASCNRRLATIGSRPISATTAASPDSGPARSPSSTAHRTSSSRRAATSTRRVGSIPCPSNPGPYRSGCFRHHSTGPEAGALESPTSPQPSPRAEREGPIAERWEGEVGIGPGPSRARMPAMNPAAAAPSSSSLPAPAISCTPPSASPPPGNTSSIAATPNGSTPCRAGPSIRRMRSRSASRLALGLGL